MQNELSEYLVSTLSLSLFEKDKTKVRLMLGIVDNLENITDEIYEVAIYIMKKNPKLEQKINLEDMQKLIPYANLVNKSIHFMHEHLNSPLPEEQFEIARTIENQIDKMRYDLKTLASEELERGAAVRTGLLYIDIIRHIERIGDFAFDISKALTLFK